MGNASLSHPTLATGSAEGVDGRVKPGHDVVGKGVDAGMRRR
jgi:hypothetical protein